VFLQRPELADAWDFRVWVEAPFEVTVPRAVNRDASGNSGVAAIQRKYERRYVPGQLMYLEQCRPRDAATVVFNNADLENPQLLDRGADVHRTSSMQYRGDVT
jgi:uridine kinase